MAPFKFLPTPLERGEWPQRREGPEQPAFSRCWPGCKTSPKTVKHPQRRAVKKRRKKRRQRATKRLAGLLHIEHQVIEVCTDVTISRLRKLAFVTPRVLFFVLLIILHLHINNVASFPAALHSLWILAKERGSELKV